jgi:hypothetical protein
MADLNDVVTVQKNGVIAINNLNQTETNAWLDTTVSPPVPYLKTISDDIAIIAGGPAAAITSATVTTSTLIVAGAGTLLNFSVVVPGTTSGLIHNSATTGGATAANALTLTPTTGGVFIVSQMKFTTGLVVVPGTGQSVNVTYTLD